jgi:hypothetical protein
MSIACIIEQDALTTQQIENTLKEIDGRLNILKFRDLEGFYKWFSVLIEQIEAESQLPTNSNQNLKRPKREDLKLLIGDIQFLGPNYFSLIEKMRKLMVRRNLILKEDDLAILLTAFESPSMDVKQIESRIITNIVFKPFDLPILKQQMQIALASQKAISDFSVFTQKLNATAEMLKEVQLESFTELGFTTRSNRALKVDDVSKYYSRHFATPGLASLHARCVSCEPHPIYPTEFKTEFRFTGISNAQVKKLRQSLFSFEAEDDRIHKVTKKILPKAPKKMIPSLPLINFLIFIKPGNDPALELKDALEQNLANIDVTFNRNMAQFMEALGKNDSSVLGHKPIHALILHVDHFNPTHGTATWTQIQDQIENFNRQFISTKAKPKILLVSSHELPAASLRSWAPLIDDVVLLPVDRPYLNKRLVTHFPDLQPRQEDIEILSTSTDEVIRVANPIEITSISEACVTLKYYRPISFHSFRRFVLPSNNEGEVHEMLGSCYFSEKQDNVYINHFVFFGITDKYLKYIRKWILERYIASKDSAA